MIRAPARAERPGGVGGGKSGEFVPVDRAADKAACDRLAANARKTLEMMSAPLAAVLCLPDTPSS